MAKTLKSVFGGILKEIRIEKGLTQQQAADYSGLDRAYISELERGELMPSLETFFKLAKVLKIKPKDFIERIEGKF